MAVMMIVMDRPMRVWKKNLAQPAVVKEWSNVSMDVGCATLPGQVLKTAMDKTTIVMGRLMKTRLSTATSSVPVKAGQPYQGLKSV